MPGPVVVTAAIARARYPVPATGVDRGGSEDSVITVSASGFWIAQRLGLRLLTMPSSRVPSKAGRRRAP